jgi:hypothetical protein
MYSDRILLDNLVFVHCVALVFLLVVHDVAFQRFSITTLLINIVMVVGIMIWFMNIFLPPSIMNPFFIMIATLYLSLTTDILSTLNRWVDGEFYLDRKEGYVMAVLLTLSLIEIILLFNHYTVASKFG